MDTLREIYGYKTFTAVVPVICGSGLSARPKMPDQTRNLAHRFIVRLFGKLPPNFLPAVSTIERLCADALVAAERRIETRIAEI
ncbi:hypothetical protein CKF46_33270 [Klebsiella pneumoniae]|nr:hypothetical protein CKF46_33270 [Klebsiella pneumoniae]